ncbi:MAG: hypothetical protein KQH79_10130 [Bacteroidetes bacterium]|nr:hypothetical protein [Bacteroidota bacterium]
MKERSFNFIILMILIFSGKAEAAHQKTIVSADSLKNLGYTYYDSNPVKCIAYNDSAAQIYKQFNDNRNVALCFQNICFAYYEKLNNPQQAQDFAVKSINLWNLEQDTLAEANIIKYLGLIQSDLGLFREAKSNIKKAIFLFKSKGFKAGEAVSYRNLGLIYKQEHKLDSCIYYLNLNKKFFVSINQNKRVFGVNNDLLECYIDFNRMEEAENIFNSNNDILKEYQIYWQDKVNFYRISKSYFENLGNKELLDFYNLKYTYLKDSLSEQGIRVM